MEDTKNTVHSYKELIVWQKSIDLVEEIYKLTEQFPNKEMYGMISQMRRSAVSIPSNIAEGRYRGTKRDYIQFLRIAYGSGAELETQIVISKRVFIIEDELYVKSESILNEVMKMLNAMIRNFNPNKLES